MLVTEKVKESDVDEDNEVDIMTVEKDSAFSDSDMSQEEICFLAANLCHDVHVQQDKCIESSSKLVDSNHSGSPLYVEAGRNGIHRTSIKSNQSIQLQQG
ncbi:Protein RBL [Camellia lanceoleosa]|uniref:Protein RBL n=1 Tax=Camellia lanceoleosa TaxID=1840588 RepID=A0ACC0ITV7_9ERIC|nr:Protein RBL [Camellia lanceoleosa]